MVVRSQTKGNYQKPLETNRIHWFHIGLHWFFISLHMFSFGNLDSGKVYINASEVGSHSKLENELLLAQSLGITATSRRLNAEPLIHTPHG